MDHLDRQPNDPLADSPAGLRRFVEAAREQPVVETCVTADAVAAGLEHQRRRAQSRRIVLLSASMAVAASLVAVGLVWPLLSARDDERSVEPIERHATATVEREPPAIPSEDAQALASAVRLRSTAAVEVRGLWSIALHDGVHEIEVDAVAGHALTIALPGRTLELVEGSLTIELADGDAAVHLHTGVAAWVDEHGGRTKIRVERFDLDGAPEADADPNEPAPTPPNAAELARAAEQRLAAGQRDQAVAIYRQLVRKHPRASQTRGAVLDLARLLRAAGRKDEARCAYHLYVERWPNSAVRSEVESQLERLGAGPDCRGLRPL